MRVGNWVFALAAVACCDVHAHDTWLLAAPGSHQGTSGAQTLALTSGMEFPVADYAIDPARIAAKGCRMIDSPCALMIGKRGAHALTLFAAVPATSAAVVWVDLAPKTLRLDEAKVREYFAEIDATPEIRAAWEAKPKPRRWRETYVKHAKSLAGSGASASTEWSTPVGSALEIVPDAQATLTVDSDVEIRVLAQEQPLADVPIGVVRGRPARAQFLHTDAQGRVRVHIDQKGEWLLRVTRLVPSTRPAVDWTSDFATLTFTVR
ncbi:MAG: DUF4198 domain-containing protein [Dokdonella sp.]|uniref:DUF4198 domain-containing protein n=1 Tax=Dokdonella sp. TaxID=2291710 RepID=UPI003263CBF0